MSYELTQEMKLLDLRFKGYLIDYSHAVWDFYQKKNKSFKSDKFAAITDKILALVCRSAEIVDTLPPEFHNREKLFFNIEEIVKSEVASILVIRQEHNLEHVSPIINEASEVLVRKIKNILQ